MSSVRGNVDRARLRISCRPALEGGRTVDERADGGVADSVQLMASVDGDVILQSLVAGAHSSETASIGITLTIPAGLITGSLIGATRWFREVGERHPEIADLATELVQEEEARELDEDSLWTYIHLRNARFFTGGRFVEAGEGFHWRGRLSEVTGWSFGEFSEAKPDA